MLEILDSDDLLTQINEDYQLWRANTPFLYDLVMTYSLVWPSLTVEWVPKALTHPTENPIDYNDDNTVSRDDYKDEHAVSSYSVHQMMVGTQACVEQNSICLIDVHVPPSFDEICPHTFGSQASSLLPPASGKIEITHEFACAAEIHRARFNPFHTNIIASKSKESLISVLDTNRPLEDDKNIRDDSHVWLSGHTKGGWALDWNPRISSYLISGSDDMLLCGWDINKTPDEEEEIAPLFVCSGHNDIIEDVCWINSGGDGIFCSVSDDNTLCLWDMRCSNHEMPSQRVIVHSAEVNCVSPSPTNEFHLATGSSDNLVKLWDTRQLKKELHSFEGHTSDVFQVQFHPTFHNILASCGADRRVLVWDLDKIGSPQTSDEALDGVPELLFVHGGHTKRVFEVSWNPHLPWVVASVSEDNILQVWEMANCIHS